MLCLIYKARRCRTNYNLTPRGFKLIAGCRAVLTICFISIQIVLQSILEKIFFIDIIPL